MYMHSEILAPGGPSAQPIYLHSRQRVIGEHIRQTIPVKSEVQSSVPSHSISDAPGFRPTDMRLTHNAGHGVLVPVANSSVALNEVRANPDNGAIPKTFMTKGVRVAWSDPRHELCPDRRQATFFTSRRSMDASALKRQEMSSELFGATRMTEASSSLSKGTPELRSALACSYLHNDSAHDRTTKQTSREKQGGELDYLKFANECNKSKERAQAGLNVSSGSQFISDDNMRHSPHAPEALDPVGDLRRRTEKNYSDLFGHQMAERRNNVPRHEYTAIAGSCWSDTRSEMTVFKQKHFYRKCRSASPRGFRSEEHPSDQGLPEQHPDPSVAMGWPGFPPSSPRAAPSSETLQITSDERACWDTRDAMTATCEVARRSRTKRGSSPSPERYQDEQQVSAFDRKRQDLDSGTLVTGRSLAKPTLFDPERRGIEEPRSPRSPRSLRPDGPFSAVTSKSPITSGHGDVFPYQRPGSPLSRTRMSSSPDTAKGRKLAHLSSSGLF